MFFLFLAISLSHEAPLYHFCDHDDIQKQTHVKAISFESSKLKMRSNEREPIRINLDFQIDKDEYQCNNPGSQVSWGYNSYTCTEADVPNETQKAALKATMENVQKYLQSIILVDRLDSSFKIKSQLDSFFTLSEAPTEASGTDIYLSVFIRTYGGSSTLASAHYISYIQDTRRPIQGAVYANNRYIPTEAQDEHTNNNNFFYTVVHEIMHALGISSSSFKYYHPKDSNEPYSNPLVSLYDKETGKNHTFLVTPYSHKFAVMQWGVEKFTAGDQSVTSGIEIEDGGGSGTAGSHPECRIGNQDLMIGVSLQTDKGPYNRFTPLTAALLLDTGNYDIVWNRIQPLVWGNKDSIDGNYIKDFVTGPPAKVFPQQYIYRPDDDPISDSCGFTFKMIGGLSMMNISGSQYYNCSGDSYKDYSNTKAYCEAEKFYNPNNDDQIGQSSEFDFQIVHFPSEICGDGSACIAGMSNCGEYKIADDEKSFTINFINDIFIECNESNAGKLLYKYDQFTFIPTGFRCPPIEQFIRTVRMMENQQYLNGDPFNPKEDDGPSSGPSNGEDDGPSSGPSKEEDDGPSSGPSNGEDDGPSSGPSKGEDDGPSNEPSTEVPKPSINESYTSSSSKITFTDNGYKDSEGKETSVDTKDDDILLIKANSKDLNITSSNSNKGNLFVSPQADGATITIEKPEGEDNLNGEIGIEANSKIAKVNLPQESVPLNLFNREDSSISFKTKQDSSVPISLNKLTISDGSIHINVPGKSTGVEFKEVETFSNGKIETYANNNLMETSIGSLKMNQGSNIEVSNAKFSSSIACGPRSKMTVNGKAKFTDTTINLTDTSNINFGDSTIEGICSEIVIFDSIPSAISLDDNEASVICGSNFDCESWKEKYSPKSEKYPYATCTKSEDQSETCLTVNNWNKPSPTKKELPKVVIIVIVVVCIIVVIIIIAAIVVCTKRRRRRRYSDESP